MQAPREKFKRDFERLAKVPEPQMRITLLGERLTELSPTEGALLLTTLVEGSLHKIGSCTTVYADLIDPEPLSQAVGTERMAAMLDCARESQYELAEQYLSSRDQIEGESGAKDEPILDKSLRNLTLGMRRSMARRARGEMINKLLTDPDPAVVTHLLNNPRMTELVVLRICSKKPTTSEALECVLRSRRWAQRSRVRAALVSNFYLRASIAIHLLPLLGSVELAAIVEGAQLSPSVVAAARLLVAHLAAPQRESQGLVALGGTDNLVDRD